ncbi:MAG: nucleotidyltransferase domain-containing protein [Bacteroidia bacterium]|nr:nucleotidyltransferase domain-containing protein [Bacteroidia bacterium]
MGGCTAKPYSDIDLAVWGLSPQEAARIALDLEELPFPYRFDVIAYEKTLPLPLRKAMRNGIEIFSRGPLRRRKGRRASFEH